MVFKYNNYRYSLSSRNKTKKKNVKKIMEIDNEKHEQQHKHPGFFNQEIQLII